MTSKLDALLKWEAELRSELAAACLARQELSERISGVQKKLAALDLLIESERGVAQGSATLAENKDNYGISTGPEDEEGDSEEADGSRTPITIRWYNFVRDRIEGYGATTTDDLLRRAPADLRRDFESVDSKYSPVFRARRLLRRNPSFRVDRQSGLVRINNRLPWPAPPSSVPKPQESDLIIKGGRPVEDGSYDLMVHPLTLQNKTEYMPFMELALYLESNFAWVENKIGELEPVSTFELDHLRRIESFKNNQWTDTFDRIARYGKA